MFAVPGEITSALSAGTNRLIHQGAAPLLGVDDVLEALGAQRRPARARELSPVAAAILELLSDAPAGQDELIRRSGRAPSEVAAALVELELAGAAAEGDGVYRALASTIAA